MRHFVITNRFKCCNKAHNNKMINEISRTREVGEVGEVGVFSGGRLCLRMEWSQAWDWNWDWN